MYVAPSHRGRIARCRHLTDRTLATALLAGIAADVTWEVWARLLTPLWVGGPLEPAALVQSVFGLQSRLPAEIIHLVVGFLFYPLGYLFIARPLARRIVPWAPWWLVALGYGVGPVDLRPLHHGAPDCRPARIPGLHPAHLGVTRRPPRCSPSCWPGGPLARRQSNLTCPPGACNRRRGRPCWGDAAPAAGLSPNIRGFCAQFSSHAPRMRPARISGGSEQC